MAGELIDGETGAVISGGADSDAGLDVVYNKRGDRFVVDGVNYKRLASGAVVDCKTAAMVANPGGGKTAIKSDNAAAMLARREAIRLQGETAGRAALRAASGGVSSLAGWRQIVEAQAGLAKDTDKGRASTEAARFVGQAAGLIGGASSQQAASNPAGATLALSPDVAKALLEVLGPYLAARGGGGGEP